MKIVVLDGYTLNPGDISWDGLKNFGDVTIYDRTPVDKVVERTAGAEIVQQDESSVAVTFKVKEDIGSLNTLLVQNGITVYSISKERKDLENLFLDITSKN